MSKDKDDSKGKSLTDLLDQTEVTDLPPGWGYVRTFVYIGPLRDEDGRLIPRDPEPTVEARPLTGEAWSAWAEPQLRELARQQEEWARQLVEGEQRAKAVREERMLGGIRETHRGVRLEKPSENELREFNDIDISF